MATLAPTIEELAVERAIAKVAESFRFVLDVTPVNVEEQRRAFLSGEVRTPDFRYRELEDAPAVLAAELAAIDLDEVEEPALRSLLSAKLAELRRQIDMLRVRGSEDFRQMSTDLYGPIGRTLVRNAEIILSDVPAPNDQSEERVLAHRFAELAERELAHYRAFEPDLGVHVEVRPDVAGVMVSGSVLLVSSATRVRASRVDALLQHEVGTHLLTHVNGRFQPIGLLASGLAGYEETQEGLAVLAEFLVGGLSAFRLRQLAARVLAVNQMLAGDSFAAVHATVVDHGFTPHSAFTTTMRVFRSGGLTKDAIYLRGLLDVLHHLHDAADLDLLWMGKFGLVQLPLLAELVDRGILSRPRIRPRFLDFPATAERLDAAASLRGVDGLIGGFR